MQKIEMVKNDLANPNLLLPKLLYAIFQGVRGNTFSFASQTGLQEKKNIFRSREKTFKV